MMFKKWIVFILFVAGMLNLVIFPSQAAKNDLKVHIISDSKDNESEIKTLVLNLAACGFNVSTGDSTQFDYNSDEFSMIILFRLYDVSTETMNNIRKTKTPSFIIGGNIIENLLSNKNDYGILSKNTGTVVMINLSDNETSYENLGYDYSFVAPNKEVVFLNNKSNYQHFGHMSVNNVSYPWMSDVGVFTYVPIIDLNKTELRECLLCNIARRIDLSSMQLKTSQYLVIDNIYPFISPSKLMGVIEYLEKIHVPYMLNIMPIYQNQDYPAAKKFYEILRYAQSKNGTIAINMPHLNGTVLEEGFLAEKMYENHKTYTDNGVYPLAAVITNDILFSKYKDEILNSYQTVFAQEKFDVYSNILSLDNLNINGQKNNIIIWHNQENQSRFHSKSNLKNAVYIDINMSDEEINDALLNYNGTSSDLRKINSSVNFFKNNYFFYNNRYNYNLNNKWIKLDFEPQEEIIKYDYHKSLNDRFTYNLLTQNAIFLIFAIISSVIFIVFIIFARIQHRKKYFYSDDENKKINNKQDVDINREDTPDERN